MERWSGKRLKNSAIYGVRVYRRGSMLHNHVDRSDTHIISAIVNVAQQVGLLTRTVARSSPCGSTLRRTGCFEHWMRLRRFRTNVCSTHPGPRLA